MSDANASEAGTSKELLKAGLKPDRAFLLCDQPPVRAADKPPIQPTARSGLFGRLNDFLPQLERANQDLQSAIAAKGAAAVDIENLEVGGDSDCTRHIEFDLGCGVLDLRDAAAERAAATAVATASTVDQDLALATQRGEGSCRGVGAGLQDAHAVDADEDSSDSSDDDDGDCAVHIREHVGDGQQGPPLKQRRRLGNPGAADALGSSVDGGAGQTTKRKLIEVLDRVREA